MLSICNMDWGTKTGVLWLEGALHFPLLSFSSRRGNWSLSCRAAPVFGMDPLNHSSGLLL